MDQYIFVFASTIKTFSFNLISLHGSQVETIYCDLITLTRSIRSKALYLIRWLSSVRQRCYSKVDLGNDKSLP